jgi:signal transduction histidine kinase
MVDALLQYAETSPTPGQSAPRPPAPVSVVEAAQEAVSVLDSWLAERRASVDIAPDLPPAWCERAVVSRVLANLIANGVKYNRSSRPQVWLGAQWAGASTLTPGGRVAVYRVRDNGIGIASKDRERAFAIFQRLHRTEEFGGGTGAGMTLSRRIVERLGGRMWIEDPPADAERRDGDGPGTVVCFTLEPEQTVES